MSVDRQPPRAVVAAVLVGLSLLLVYPLHRRYLYPEQDVPIVAAMSEFERGGLQPFIVVYPSALTNLLRLGDEALFVVGRAAGWYRERADLRAAWARAPWRFRLPARLVAVGLGIATLVATWATAVAVMPGWPALVGPLIAGTSLMFVREFHHGMYDAPAAGAAMIACALATGWLVRPRPSTLAGAAAAAALAIGFKYNLGVAAAAILGALAVAPAGVGRIRAGIVAVAAAVVTLIVVMPVVVLDPRRLVHDLGQLGPRQVWILQQAAAEHGPHGLGAAMALGFGVVATAAAGVGMGLAIARRERRLVPVGAFVLAYGLVLIETPLVINRYAVPLAAPLAVFAAYAIAALPRRSLRVVAASALVALGLPATLQHLRLLATEDTRVEAARWIERHQAAGDAIFLTGNAAAVGYAGPDVMMPIRPAEAEPGKPPPLRYFDPPPGDANDATRLARFAGGYVVTTEHPLPKFWLSTPREQIALLERHARVVLDLPFEREPDPTRVYEPFDLHYIPFTGLGTLSRPGPHIRVWSVPAG
jgi:hypothetical protein